MSNFEETLASLIVLHGLGHNVGTLLNTVLDNASHDDMVKFCEGYGYDFRGLMVDRIREIVRAPQPAAAAEPAAAEHTTYALKASSSSSSSSSISEPNKKQTWADITEDEEKKASASEEGCKGDKDQGDKDQGGKGRGGKGRGGKGRGGKGRGGKGQCRGRGGKGVEPATVPSKPSRPKVKPTTACAHLVLGKVPVCPYEASGICTFLHEGIYQESGQPTNWLEITPGTWTGQKEGEFGISVATGGVVWWDTETYAYEKSSSKEFLDFLADRAVWKSKNS